MVDRDLFFEKMSTLWGVENKLLFKLNEKTPLYQWLMPRPILYHGNTDTNWGVWLRSNLNEMNNDPSIIHATKCFHSLLTTNKSVTLFHGPSIGVWSEHCRMYTMDTGNSSSQSLSSAEHIKNTFESATVSHILRNEFEGEEEILICPNGMQYDHFTKENNYTTHFVYLYNESAQRTTQAVCVLQEQFGVNLSGSIKTLFQRPHAANECLRMFRDSAVSIVYVTACMTVQFTTNKCATTLIKHVQAMFPKSLIVVFAPPVLSTFALYNYLGFKYASIYSESHFLKEMIFLIEGAVQAWHSGFPHLTYMDPYIEEYGVRLSYSSKDASFIQEMALKSDYISYISMDAVKEGDMSLSLFNTLHGTDEDRALFIHWIWDGLYKADCVECEQLITYCNTLLASQIVQSITIIHNDADINDIVRYIPLKEPIFYKMGSPTWEGYLIDMQHSVFRWHDRAMLMQIEDKDKDPHMDYEEFIEDGRHELEEGGGGRRHGGGRGGRGGHG